MKKRMFILLSLLLLSGTPLQAYTVSGKVYHKGTTIPVSGASVNLTASSGASTWATTDNFGSFSLGWSSSNMVGQTMVLGASKGVMTGQTPWKATQNTESKDVYISVTVEANPSLTISTVPMRVAVPPAGPVANPAIIKANNPVVVNNAQINFVFNPAVMNPVNVAPAMPGTNVVWSVPQPGKLQVNVEVNPPRLIQPDYPAESFFDIFFEIIVPQTDAIVTTVTMDEAMFNGGTLSGQPSVTENLIGEPELCKPHFLVDAQQDWTAMLEADWPQANISPMSPAEWNHPEWGYMMQWDEFLQEGVPYPTNQFLPPELYVYEGDGDEGQPDPDDAGLVMKWGDTELPDGGYSSAWKYDYGLDPDLSNCIITVTATPPSAAAISNISLGMQDANGNIRSWQWTCGPAGVLPYDVPTTITIDTSKIGLAAATPPASGYANNPSFDLKQVQYLIADENSAWVGGPTPVPPGGQQIPGLWNYWHNLSVTNNTKAYKGTYIKWTQPPVVLDENAAVPKINGWDEMSVHQPAMQPQQIMADDWLCNDERPITDLHWWGSFIGWTQPHLPAVLPKAFHIGIWTDVPAGQGLPYSHPGTMIWEHTCDNWVWNFAGYDVDPRLEPIENEACFQFNQLLSQDDWFYQEPSGPEGTVYWVSIAAIYDATAQVTNPWGWKTRPHFYNDDAVRIQATGDGTWPPTLGAAWGSGTPVEYPAETSWDLAFELTTNQKAYVDDPIPGDIGGPGGSLTPDGTVNLNDLAIMAANWLKSAP